MNIIDKYLTNNNIICISQANQGISAARNAGIKTVQSSYIMFVDSDDTLCENAIELLLDKAIKENCDLVYGGHNIISNYDKVCVINHSNDYEVPGFACAKVFRKEIFEKICFPIGYWYEDSIIKQVVCATAKKIGNVGECVYNYRINNNGITRGGINNPKTLDSLYITMQLYKDRQILGFDINEEYYQYLLRMAILTYYRTIKMPNSIKKDIFNVYASFINNIGTNIKICNTKYDNIIKSMQKKDYNMYSLYCLLH